MRNQNQNSFETNLKIEYMNKLELNEIIYPRASNPSMRATRETAAVAA